MTTPTAQSGTRKVRGFDPRPAAVLPAQRRRFVRTEVAV